jgi:phosphatidate cytidylyltransferase
MLRTRLWMGGLLILLAVGVLVADSWLSPWHPLLLVLVLTAAGLATHELLWLLPEPKPRGWLCQLGTGVLILTCWWAQAVGLSVGSWPYVAGAFAGLLFLFFVVEAAHFHGPGQAVQRIAAGVWLTAYIGLMACFFLPLRWIPGTHGAAALALAIFVPKVGDIGAYTVGRLIGRHRMAPVLSPKKTWEGAAGGLLAAIAVALGINALSQWGGGQPLLGWHVAAGFGITVGIVAMLGDLMESMVKRDCERKDASEIVPGFGGMLDVIDSILLSAPASYFWIFFMRPSME